MIANYPHFQVETPHVPLHLCRHARYRYTLNTLCIYPLEDLSETSIVAFRYIVTQRGDEEELMGEMNMVPSTPDFQKRVFGSLPPS